MLDKLKSIILENKVFIFIGIILIVGTIVGLTSLNQETPTASQNLKSNSETIKNIDINKRTWNITYNNSKEIRKVYMVVEYNQNKTIVDSQKVQPEDNFVTLKQDYSYNFEDKIDIFSTVTVKFADKKGDVVYSESFIRNYVKKSNLETSEN